MQNKNSSICVKNTKQCIQKNFAIQTLPYKKNKKLSSREGNFKIAIMK
jgi:hypothetical protein